MRPIEGEHPYVYSTMKLAPTDPIQAEHACKMGARRSRVEAEGLRLPFRALARLA